MKLSGVLGKTLACVPRKTLLPAGLLCIVTGHAAAWAAGASSAGVQHLSASLNASARTESTLSSLANDPPSRADLQRMFKARCPGRVERLLGVALPAERPDFKVIADICSCATQTMEASPDTTTVDQFRTQAAQVALACSKNTITAHNELRARHALGPYLSAQGLDEQQVAHFSQCAASTHWKNTVETSLGDANTPSTNAWWSVCTEQIGRKGLPEPQR